MSKQTPQMDAWSGAFGQAYTERNLLSPRELDALYEERLGVSRRALNEQFIGHLDRTIRVLEVGSNVGNQLLILQEMGFSQLYGIELQWHAVELSKQRCRGINILQGSAFDIPFRDRYFDLVFTSGVLIHLAPSDIGQALREIHRCTRRFIWGMEYFAPEYQEVRYREREGLLWKTDFARLYLEHFPDLRIVRQSRFRERAGANEDAAFLLEREP
jgi:pseudaminic acid biosynthesis-associated methylase